MEEEYIILTGESYRVLASNGEEALQRMYKYLDGADCDCTKTVCDCVEYNETRTEII